MRRCGGNWGGGDLETSGLLLCFPEGDDGADAGTNHRDGSNGSDGRNARGAEIQHTADGDDDDDDDDDDDGGGGGNNDYMM